MFEFKNIKLARESRGISQKELAAKIDVSPGTISKMESGTMLLTDRFVKAIANVLSYPLSFFLNR